MLSVLYIIFCTAFGWVLLDSVVPGLKEAGKETYGRKALGIPVPVYMLPASWLTGTIFHTWLVYIMASVTVKIAPDIRYPLTPANIAAAIVSLAVGLLLYFFVLRKREKKPLKLEFNKYMLLIIPLALFLGLHFYRTFHYSGSTLKIGFSVFSDFATHIGMIRSFSFGNNIPAQYSHFAGTDIRYHFMFQFLTGNLEYLGFRIDNAFNIASLLSMLSACILLYVYAVKLTGYRAGGILSTAFMLFRSSPSLLRYLAETDLKVTDVFDDLWNRSEFFAYTTREDWGLWNLKVYMNQRHLAFAMAITFLVLIVFTPLVIKMLESLESCESTREKAKTFFAGADSWLPSDYIRPAAYGVLLGAMAFWNGAMLIGCLSILFVMAFFSKHRLEYLITAVIAVVMSFIQSSVFIDGSAMDLKFQFGFIVENSNVFSVARYLVDLAWPLPLLVIICMFAGKGVLRLQTCAFTAPLIIAFTLSMVPEMAVNHKYVMLSFILFGIPVAQLICRIWENRLSGKIAAVILCIFLMCTGLIECRILWNLDENAFEYRNDDPMINWIHENTDSHDIWLTPMYHIARPVVGGAMLYYGWPYYSWGAGYDTLAREENVIQMYGANDAETLKALTARENISYIIVDADAKDQYIVREDVIAEAFPIAYTEGEDWWRVTIYKVE
ncbi:MAG: hypothetical protein J5824_04305 [Lachnospiraceae bacterium]|nr:hypothetical protein [Lachnospiraceae bacterium]